MSFAEVINKVEILNMDEHQFKQRLDDAVNLLVETTQESCFNTFAPKYRFRIRPSTTAVDHYLNKREISFLKKINRYRKSLLKAERVVRILYQEDKVLAWINMSVLESRRKVTIIELVCSRRLRVFEELNHVVDPYAPFHIVVPEPPDDLRVEADDGRFDINWQRKYARSKRKGLMARIRRMFGN